MRPKVTINNYKMIERITLFVLLLFGCAGHNVAKVKLPVMLSDGMVIQRDAPVMICGWADAGEVVEVRFLEKIYLTVPGSQGMWAVILEPSAAGGPYTLTINDTHLRDILVGDVWLCAGQSNMETGISRVMDLLAGDILPYENTNIRHVKLQRDYSFSGPGDDVSPTAWKPVTQENVMSMTAVPYFFARYIYEATGVPIGLVNAAVGGSPAQAWVGEEFLGDFPYYVRDKKMCEAEGYIEASLSLQHTRELLYAQSLNAGDTGLKENWKDPSYDDSGWQTTSLFAHWGSDGRGPVNGSHWLRKDVEVPSRLAGKQAVLRLGCIVDSDSVFVNGSFVGATGYQYPPRIYTIPEGLLKEGRNNITIRLFGNAGRPHFVEDKPYKILFGQEEISLSGDWKHRVGCRMLPLPAGIGFQNKASVLYDAMIAPLRIITFKGVLWYQGEANTGAPGEYYGLVSNLISNWRALFRNPGLPFIVAQLPNFMPSRDYPSESGWAEVREAQLLLSRTVPHVGMSVNIDLGEWNDIHPLNKKDVGYRMALQAQRLAYGNSRIVADGPVYESHRTEGNRVILSFRKGTDGLQPVAELKGFSLAGADSRHKWATARIEGNTVIVWNDEIPHPVELRYAWADNPDGANLRNTAGLPASPFRIKTEQE